ncbi:MAG: two-CW domain-containing protein [Nitrospirota bacterium]
MEKINCWEYKKCGKDETGDCPAYPRGGRACYLLAGTMGEGKVQGSFALKIGNCRECDFYKRLVNDKAHSRKDHLMGHPHSFK